MVRIYILTLILIISQITGTLAQSEWDVPEDKASMLHDSKFTEENAKLGKALFEKNCMSCHGTPGKANFNAALVPSPGDPASEKFQSNKDGMLLYKIKEGKGLMPSFKNTLSNDDIWNIIAYLRTFNDKYIQEIIEKIDSEGLSKESVELLMKYLEDKQQICVTVQTKDSLKKGIANAEVKLFALRSFGKLLIDEPKNTNNEGNAYFSLPNKLPGDSIGNITCLAKLSDEDTYGAISKQESFVFGVPTNKPGLTEERAMWNIMKKAPIWLLFVYFGTVVVIFGFIGYTLLLLKKVFEAGKD